jgi:hypothetical protein
VHLTITCRGYLRPVPAAGHGRCVIVTFSEVAAFSTCRYALRLDFT